MIEELVGRVFATRNAAHLAHWAAKGPGSYAKHVALDGFYNELIDKIDTIVEMYQGAHGLIGDVILPKVDPTKIVQHIAEEATWIADCRDDIAEDVDAIKNQIDDLVGHYLTSLYKLKNLA